MNPTGMKFICFSRFFYAFLCLCCLQTRVRVLCFVCVGSWSFGVGISLHLSCWILDSVRKILTSFEIFSQPAEPARKPNQPIHWVQFPGTTVWVLCSVCVGSWSFGVRIALCFSFWILDSLMKVLKSFEIFSQLEGLVGKPNHPIHWVQFSEMEVWILCFVCVGSWSFGAGIILHLSCFVSESVRKVLTSFEIIYQ